MTTPHTTFAAATAVTPLSSHIYAANFPPDWVVGNVPHGGIVTSLFLRVASTHFRTTLAHLNQLQTTTLHLTFLRRTRIGPAVFIVKDAKLGRGTSTIHVTLRQPEPRGRQKRPHEGTEQQGNDDELGPDLVVGYLTHASPSSSSSASASTSPEAPKASPPSTHTYTTSWTLQAPPPPFAPSLLTSTPSAISFPTPPSSLLSTPDWIEHPYMPYSIFRKASQHCRFLFPRAGHTQAGIFDQWFTLRSGEPWSAEALGFACDSFPQVVEGLETPGVYDVPTEPNLDLTNLEYTAGSTKGNAKYWYPTVLLNLDIKKPLPSVGEGQGPTWLFLRLQAKQVRDGRYDLEVIIMDAEGDLVALSHHVCLVVDASRNTAERKGGRDKESRGRGQKTSSGRDKPKL